jgi:hypothetical protein
MTSSTAVVDFLAKQEKTAIDRCHLLRRNYSMQDIETEDVSIRGPVSCIGGGAGVAQGPGLPVPITQGPGLRVMQGVAAYFQAPGRQSHGQL